VHDGDGALRVVEHSLGDGSEQGTRDAAATAGADDDQGGARRPLDERSRRVALDDLDLDLDLDGGLDASSTDCASSAAVPSASPSRTTW
jgi:hypothetical protein